MKDNPIQVVNVADIKIPEYYTRTDPKPDNPAMAAMSRSTDRWGILALPVVNGRTMHLLDGRLLLRAAIDAGLAEVRVFMVDVDPDEEKVLHLKLNEIRNEFDDAKRAALYEELLKVPDLECFLDDADRDAVHELLVQVALASSPAADDEAFDVAAALDDARSHPAVTKVGEVVKLNGHVLVCGDATDPAAIQLATEGSPAALLLTDPPYNVKYDAASRGPKRPPGKQRKLARAKPKLTNDHLPQAKYARMLSAAVENAVRVLTPGGAAYIWNGSAQIALTWDLLTRCGAVPRYLLTWAKPGFAISRGDYQQQTEYCVHGWKNGGKHRWYGGRNQSTLWEIDRDPTRSYVHPTQKPLELAERAIRNSSAAGDLVLDPFLGGGTTLIACERTGRRCAGVEIDPYFCDVVVRRYVKFTGGKGVNADVLSRYALTAFDTIAKSGSSPSGEAAAAGEAA